MALKEKLRNLYTLLQKRHKLNIQHDKIERNIITLDHNIHDDKDFNQHEYNKMVLKFNEETRKH